jgi:hypothetical protein
MAVTMKVNGAWLLEQRALHLAIVHLSRRDDLSISEPKDESGIDLLVTIEQAGKVTGRMFGVVVKASRSLSGKPVGHENQFKLQLSIPSMPEELPFPLALFVFNMADDEGYFRWLLAPVLTTENTPPLLLNLENIFTKISPVSIDSVIAQVNRWYEVRIQRPMNGELEMVTV